MENRRADFRRKQKLVAEDYLGYRAFEDSTTISLGQRSKQADAFEIDASASMRYFLLLNGVAPEAKFARNSYQLKRILAKSAPEVDPGCFGPITIVLVL